MKKENPLQTLLSELNRKYALSNEFKIRVSGLLNRLEGFNLQPDQLEVLAGKLRDTYERQLVVESCREENRKSLERIQSSINAYSNALNIINQQLNQAEAALENLINSKLKGTPSSEEKQITLLSDEKAKALAAFVSINSKNSRVN